MAKNPAQTSVRPTATIPCDWCFAPCRPAQITSMSSAKLCQGCASHYFGDEEDAGDGEDEKKKKRP